MTLPEIRADILRKVGIEFPATAPSYLDEDVLSAINMAGQLLNTVGDPFWKLEIRTDVSQVVTPIAGWDKITLDGHSVKKVYMNSYALMRCESLSELFQWNGLYPSAQTVSPVYAKSYFVEPLNNLQTSVYIGHPQIGWRTLPGGLKAPYGEFEIHYVPKFQNWISADLSNNALTPSIPFGYIETLFLPIARFYMSRSHWYYNESLLKRLTQDFQSAIQMIKEVNPTIALPTVDQLTVNVPVQQPQTK